MTLSKDSVELYSVNEVCSCPSIHVNYVNSDIVKLLTIEMNSKTRRFDQT